jgi:hypothetical protein
VLTQQLQEPITESAQEDKYIHSKEINIKTIITITTTTTTTTTTTMHPST